MPATLNADNLRRWALQCEDQAHTPGASGYQRARLMKMRESLLILADEEDFSKLAKRMPELNNEEILSLAERMTGIAPLTQKG